MARETGLPDCTRTHTHTHTHMSASQQGNRTGEARTAAAAAPISRSPKNHVIAIAEAREMEGKGMCQSVSIVSERIQAHGKERAKGRTGEETW